MLVAHDYVQFTKKWYNVATIYLNKRTNGTKIY